MLLYQLKYQYEELIKNLNDNYNRLEKIYSNLLLYRKKGCLFLKINEAIFSSNELDVIINNISNNKTIIKNKLIPEAKKKYYKILEDISNS